MNQFFFETVLWGAFAVGVPILMILGVLNIIQIGRISMHIKSNYSVQEQSKIIPLGSESSIIGDKRDDTLQRLVNQAFILRKIIKNLVIVDCVLIILSFVVLKIVYNTM